MGTPPGQGDLVCKGTKGEVRYATRQNGAMEAKGWLEAQPQEVQARFSVLFEAVCNQGFIHNKRQYRPILGESGLVEFKRHSDRILCFVHEGCWWLTHSKKSKKLRFNTEIEHAKTIREEHLCRLRNRPQKDR